MIGTKNLISFEKKEIFEKIFDEILRENKYGDELKKKLKEELQKYYEKGFINQTINSNFKLFYENYKESLLELLKSKRFAKIIISAELLDNSRLAINTSSGFGKEIFEVGIHMHPIYSIPFIPGSSIKGAFRRGFRIYREKKLNNKDEADLIELLLFGTIIEEENNRYKIIRVEIKEEIVKRLFDGKLSKKLLRNEKLIEKLDKLVGGIIFLDAYPYRLKEEGDIEIELENGEKRKIGLDIPNEILTMDIINKHYDEENYFSNDSIKSGEYINPNPIIFLDIKEKTPFTFLMLVDSELWELYKIKESILSSIILTFEINGLGAKTTYGYGRFKINKIYIVK